MGTDIWSTANPANAQGPGWLGRYLDSLGGHLDPLVGWNTFGQTPHAMIANTVGVPSITDPARYAFSSPNTGKDATLERSTTAAIASHVPVSQPHIAFVGGVAEDAMATLDRVATVGSYAPSVAYPSNGLGLALKTVAGAMAKGIGTRVFWVQTGGFDTHSAQQVNQAKGNYMGLMATLNDGVLAFYNDLKNQGLLNQTLILQFSEFGRRITENGSGGTDHGAASTLFALGGSVHGGIYGTAPSLNPDPGNPTLENSGGDVHFETDFRSVYARGSSTTGSAAIQLRCWAGITKMSWASVSCGNDTGQGAGVRLHVSGDPLRRFLRTGRPASRSSARNATAALAYAVPFAEPLQRAIPPHRSDRPAEAFEGTGGALHLPLLFFRRGVADQRDERRIAQAHADAGRNERDQEQRNRM